MPRPTIKQHLPDWVQEWLDVIVPAGQILLILAVALLLQRLLRRLVRRAAAHYGWPHALVLPLNGLIRWSILGGALLLVLERLGVSATVLWTAFTGFATVGAVAFFAAWSVLSNLFCAVLIFTVRPLKPGDTIELLDTAEKPGAKGQVVDVNLLYTTLQEAAATPEQPGALLQIPNTLVFQRVLRRWPAGAPLPTAAAPQTTATQEPPAVQAPAPAEPSPSPTA